MEVASKRSLLFWVPCVLAVLCVPCLFTSCGDGDGANPDASADTDSDTDTDTDTDADTDTDSDTDTDADSDTDSETDTAGSLSWVRSAGGIGADVGGGVAAFSDEALFVVGSFSDTATFGAGEANETTLVSAGDYDVFIAKYATDGSLVWAERAGGDGDSAETGVDVIPLADGAALVAGYIGGTATFGAGEIDETTLTSAGGVDMFVAEYAADGSLSWVKSAGGSEDDSPRSISADEDGAAFVTGGFRNAATFGAGEANETELIAVDEDDLFVAKYAADGSLSWAQSVAGEGYEEGVAVAVLSDDSVLVTGNISSTATFGVGEANETTLTSVGDSDIFIAKYDADGNLSWAKSMGGSNADNGVGASALPDGGFLISGTFFSSATLGAGEANETTLTSAGGSDAFVAKYAADGSLSWARSAGGSEPDLSMGVSVSEDGSIVSAGAFGGMATFGAGEANETMLTSAGDNDIFIASYTADGSLSWARSAGGSGSDWSAGVSVFEDGSIIAAGAFAETATFGTGEANETTLIAAGAADMFIAKYNP